MKSISNVHLFVLAAMIFSVFPTNPAITATFDYFGINHSIYEDGIDVYRVSFTLSDGNGNIYSQNIVNSLEMSDDALTYNVDNIQFFTGHELYGLYNNVTGEIDFDPIAVYTEYYGPIIGVLTNGEYKLIANITSPSAGVENVEITNQWNHTHSLLPVVSSASFRMQTDNSGNFIFEWDAPNNLNDTTNSRISIEVFSDLSWIGDIYLRVPTDLGKITIPSNIVQQVEGWGGTRYELFVNIRTNNSQERTYSNRKVVKSLTNPNGIDFPWILFLPSTRQKMQ